ncbi:hypothetical protein HPB51_007271 [Rhipicephalus microplus]|uniref:MADF domain-containing protein n=1 Tax=Rhipicephalus microplus TaxID=6941 RepID=A0A9J6EYB5_RHIMP|nr:hypothetical protein HPB51_007271 [Rhipicephalus microplus]
MSDETGRSRDVSRTHFRAIARFSRFGNRRSSPGSAGLKQPIEKNRKRIYISDALPVVFTCFSAFSHNYHNNMANGDECNAYNERLIEVLERERPLWDLCDRNYKSRAVTDAAWRYVATVMGSTVAEVKARWKNLRDTFRRVLEERTRALKSGAPANDELDESTKWHFFSRLLFLKETMKGRPTSGNVGPLPFKESAPDVLAPECILEDVCDELPGNQGTATSSGLPPPPKKKKPKRSKYDDEIEELSKFITEKPDEHERFGEFLVEKMRRVPPHFVDVMQLQLLETVTQFLNPVTVVQPVD